ncbi:MAG: MGMT family protein [archaeon]
MDEIKKKKVLELISSIPKGKVSSYKIVADKLKVHPRVVAHALSSNKHPIVIPCHRVVHHDGRVGGYTPKGTKEKIRILKEEGVEISDGKIDEEDFCFFN